MHAMGRVKDDYLRMSEADEEEDSRGREWGNSEWETYEVEDAVSGWIYECDDHLALSQEIKDRVSNRLTRLCFAGLESACEQATRKIAALIRQVKRDIEMAGNSLARSRNIRFQSSSEDLEAGLLDSLARIRTGFERSCGDAVAELLLKEASAKARMMVLEDLYSLGFKDEWNTRRNDWFESLKKKGEEVDKMIHDCTTRHVRPIRTAAEQRTETPVNGTPAKPFGDYIRWVRARGG
jgi:hypothetical protein